MPAATAMTVRATISEGLTLTPSADRIRSSFDSSPGQPVSYFHALRDASASARPYREYARAASGASHPDLAAENEGELLAVASRVPTAARRREIPAPERVVPVSRVDQQVAAALEGVRVWRISERREARRVARATAERVADLDYADAKCDVATRQEQLDGIWERLRANDPDAVLVTVEEAFEQRKLPAVALDVRDDRLTVGLVLDSVESVVPERRPNVTPTGRRTLKKRTKTEVNEFYLSILAALSVAAVREAASVAPAVTAIVLVACRAIGGSTLECVYVGEFDATSNLSAPSAPVLFDRGASMIDIGGRSQELRALDLAGEPDVARVVDLLSGARRGRTR
jgi:hypothetical protein